MTIYDELYKKTSISNLQKSNKTIYDDISNKTKFLNNTKKVTHRQRLWHIVHGVLHIPKCIQCNNNVMWQTKIRGYSTYCSAKCVGVSDKIKLKKKQSCLLHFGVDSFSKTDTFKHRTQTHDTKVTSEKRKETCITKYGAESYLSSTEGKIATQRIIKSKYGVDNVRKSDRVIRKIKDTIKDKYNVTHYNLTNEYKQTMNLLYADPTYKQSCISKTQNTMLTKYGVLNTHLLKLSPDQRSKLNDLDWLSTQHTNQKRSISDIANELCVDKQTVLRRFHDNNIAIHRYQSSTAENELVEFLRQYTDVIQHDRLMIAPKELDIVIPSKKLAIEFNGSFWHSEYAGKDKWYHHNKTSKCTDQGFQLLHIYDDDWTNKAELIKSMILHKLQLTSDESIYARLCDVVSVSQQTKKIFFNAYHIQGNGPSSIQYGLMINGELCCVIGFIMCNDNTCYLNRYASKNRVVGGFSRLVKHFIKQHPEIKQIISFADMDISDGNLYYETGFVLDRILPPDYKYVVNGQRVHKFNFRKAKLHKIFGDIDTNWTESQIMSYHNIPRIWNVGLLRFVYKIRG